MACDATAVSADGLRSSSDAPVVTARSPTMFTRAVESGAPNAITASRAHRFSAGASSAISGNRDRFCTPSRVSMSVGRNGRMNPFAS